MSDRLRKAVTAIHDAAYDLRAALAAEPEPSDDGNGKLARLREWIEKRRGAVTEAEWSILAEIDRLMAEPEPQSHSTLTQPAPAAGTSSSTAQDASEGRLATDRAGDAGSNPADPGDFNVRLADLPRREPKFAFDHGPARPMEAETRRLRSVIDATAKHWLDADLDIPFEGGVDGAMQAAVGEIRRLREERDQSRELERMERTEAMRFWKQRDAAIAERDKMSEAYALECDNSKAHKFVAIEAEKRAEKWTGMAVELEQVGALFELREGQTILGAVKGVIAEAEKAEAFVSGYGEKCQEVHALLARVVDLLGSLQRRDDRVAELERDLVDIRAKLDCEAYPDDDEMTVEDRIVAERVALQARVAELEAALRQIAKGEGPFSRDQLTHAENTIEAMKAMAADALLAKGEGERRCVSD